MKIEIENNELIDNMVFNKFILYIVNVIDIIKIFTIKFN